MEPQTDVPIFLIEDMLLNWRQKHAIALQMLSERRNGYLIDEIPEGIGRGNMGIEYSFVTSNKGKWQIFIQPQIEYQPSTIGQDALGRISQELEVRQKINNEHQIPEEIKHQKALDFLAANWQKIFSIFYPLAPEGEITPSCFTEVNLNEYGTADFIGVGPDGKIIIVEIGKGGKSQQVNRYRDGLIDLSTSLGFQLNERDVSVYTLIYSSRSEGTRLMICSAKTAT